MPAATAAVCAPQIIGIIKADAVAKTIAPTNTVFRADLARYEWIRNRVPMKRWGAPEDLMRVAVFLGRAASAFITGQLLIVDRGMTIAI